MNEMFGPREIIQETADRWWIFLVTGIAWLVFALLVFSDRCSQVPPPVVRRLVRRRRLARLRHLAPKAL